jgi:hypothetical protein
VSGRRRRWRPALRLPAGIRRATDPVVASVPVRVRNGPNRGARWSRASAGSGYASGRRAAAQMRLLAELIREDDIVWGVGAHHGYITLLAAARVGARGQRRHG